MSRSQSPLVQPGVKMSKKGTQNRETRKGGNEDPPSGMSLVASYCRIKPLNADSAKQSGGVASAKRITGWDEDSGMVELSGEAYKFARSTLPPNSSQAHVYDVIAQPLVRAWLEGYDVDLISYGQTGAGKTFTMFGPPFSMAAAAKELGSNGSGISGDGILLEEHGFILRAGFEALAAVESINSCGGRAVLHGSMVEMSIMSLVDQSVIDLLNNRQTCYVDKQHHLQGARLVPLQTAADIVNMAAAVETRLTRGTKMNDTSSRSHCVTVFTMSMLEGSHSTTACICSLGNSCLPNSSK